jgi:hypothetical protein
MTEASEGTIEQMKQLIERRMEAINARDIEGVLSCYDDYSVFVWDVPNKLALMGKAEIRAWAEGLPERTSEYRTDHTLDWEGTHMRKTWQTYDAKTNKFLFGGYDLYWGEGDRVIRQEAYWTRPA